MALRVQDINLSTTSFSNRTSVKWENKPYKPTLGEIKMCLMAEDISSALLLPGMLTAVPRGLQEG